MQQATWWSLAVGLALAAGCAEKNAGVAAGTGDAPGSTGATTAAVAAVTNRPGPTVPAWPPTKAQPKLRTMKLYVGPKVITAEIAINPVEVGTGMMFRTSMAEDEGMLFLLRYPQRASFYMKNTTVPLTAAYIDPDGVIQELVDLHPLVETPVEAKSDNILFVLEMNQGWFKRNNITPGAGLTTDSGTLKQTFGFGQ